MAQREWWTPKAAKHDPSAAAFETPSDEQLAEILRLNRIIYEALQRREHQHPAMLAHISPAFEMSVDRIEGRFTWPEYLASGIPQMRRENPEYPPQVLNEQIDWDGATGTATVWYVVRTRAYPDGVVRDGLGVHKWRVEGGVWKCFAHKRFRSGFGYPFDFD